MCGIIAVLRRRATRRPPERSDIEPSLNAALAHDLQFGAPGLGDALLLAANDLETVDRLLKGPLGVAFLLEHDDLRTRLHDDLGRLEARLDGLEADLDRGDGTLGVAAVEAINAALLRLRDAAWALRRDRVRIAEAVGELCGERRSTAAIEAFCSVHTALSAIDRLEVRGRDSAGLHVSVTGHALRIGDPEIAQRITKRSGDVLFQDGSLRVLDGGARLCFAYKCAAEIGELGDNVAALRASILADDLLRTAVAGDDAEVVVLGHTRWASVGIISEANAHPLDAGEIGRDGNDHYSAAALNGDVDNHAQLTSEHGLELPDEITTDAKVIPCLMSRQLAEGTEPGEAFRRTVAAFDGSVAIGSWIATTPDDLWFALRGSGQALYVGLADDAFVVASEPYGVVEETDRYLRMDGETPGNPSDPVGSRGQIVRLSRDSAGELAGVERIAYDGTALPIDAMEIASAGITTRDVDRGDYPHFLLKEISESPRSFQKTLRGKIREVDGQLHAHVGPSALPDAVCERLRSGSVRRILTIGQGTAAVAARGIADAIDSATRVADVAVATLPATELSGFQMRDDMSDTLIVAISQSGTTTDTNRTVDLVRQRGAHVVAIVNRRGSDLTDKADGVLYTSDGRDVEMSVASTKAFYAQIAAGFVLSFAIARELGVCDESREHEMLTALRELPDAMKQTLALREDIARATREHVTSRRYWAMVGNGSNRIAAEELRIKLSELCYKSIACDATEDKKHIDLSSEPMVLVCAAGLTGSNADDVRKEVAIYRAHKALPIVIATEGEARFDAASVVLPVPAVHPELAFVLTTVAGHLFGYEAALAIDALAQPLREARAAIEQHARGAVDGETLLHSLAPELIAASEVFQRELRRKRLDGQLEASTATRLAALFRYACGITPVATFQLEFGRPGTPGRVIDDLTAALTAAIEELTRPVDAIKHQAKTVTVGISRSDETLIADRLVQKVLQAGTPREQLTYTDLRALAALAPTVAKVNGHTRYAIEGSLDDAIVRVVDQGGSARELRSRTADRPELRGTKHQVARERQILVARGRSDGRTFILVPEVRSNQVTGLMLLHVEFHEALDAATLRAALSAYRNRYATLVDAVTETEPKFKEELLASLPVAAVLTEPVHVLADHWRHAKNEA